MAKGEEAVKALATSDDIWGSMEAIQLDVTVDASVDTAAAYIMDKLEGLIFWSITLASWYFPSTNLRLFLPCYSK